MNMNTHLIHAGTDRGTHYGAAGVPIYQASTFHQPDPGEPVPYDYSRSGNPTREALETAIAELEGGAVGMAFASGMAATSSALMLFEPGDHLVVARDIYGGSYRVLTGLFKRWKLEVTFADTTNPDAVRAAITPQTRGLFLETPANPLLSITDLCAMVELAREHNLLTIADNTFMTPYLQRPLELGIDIVVHSATKFLGGHSDVIAGLAVTRDEKTGRHLRSVQNAFGCMLAPHDCWLTLRGIRTLAVRLEAQQKTTEALARWLQARSEVKSVFYPGLEEHPGCNIHAGQASGAGAVLSFDLGDGETAKRFMKALKLPLVAVSLGGVESILSYPAMMSHAAMPREERQARGIGDGLLRLSVGLESFDDLVEDLSSALRAK